MQYFRRGLIGRGSGRARHFLNERAQRIRNSRLAICPQARPREQIYRGRPAELDGPLPTTFPGEPRLSVERCLKLHQSAAARDGDCFRAAQNIQLGEDVAQMPLHRGFADEEIRADFLVAFAARQQHQHS